MRINIPILKLKSEYERIVALHWAHFLLFEILVFLQMFYSLTTVMSGILRMILVAIIYHFFFRTLKHLYYTFWTFAVFIVLYLISVSLLYLFYYHNPFLSYVSLLTLTILSVELYLISSPIFYPLVRWWEFDFRYRSDIKIELTYEAMSFLGRLTDLRRFAGCVVSFDDFPLRKSLTIKAILKHQDEELENIILHGALRSKRANTIGRGFTYGVQFYLKNADEKKAYKKLMRYWHTERRTRLRKKFQRENSHEQ